MKRWNIANMLNIGKKLFAKMHKQKYHAHHNHDIHFMAREIDEWLPTGINQICNGTYSPRPLRRYYFPDEMVDQLHPTDRVFQHVLLQVLKLTFKHVMNTNCYHLHSPTGVKYAAKHIRKILAEKKPQFFIRADVKSFYKSIPHFKLIQDIKKYYDDPKLLTMLEDIISNPIDTPYGYKNPVHGIALRGPLSQFFSGVYLKPLDDAFNKMDVTYIRYQDDILILCQTKRQLNRCRRRMMEVLNERHLSLSRKKSRIGNIGRGFHFLGIDYLPTQTEDNTNVTHANDATISLNAVHYLDGNGGGGKTISEHQQHELICIVPHARTLRKAREQVKQMVITGTSSRRIRRYLHRWVMWWAITSNTWHYQELLRWFMNVCRHEPTAHYAAGLSQLHFFKRSCIRLVSVSTWLHKLCKFVVFARHKFCKAPPRAPHRARAPSPQIY